MSRPNKCIKDENGKDQWISRSTVVIPIVFKIDNETGDIYTIVEQRGNAVTHPGEWCCPCGFIDWDETLEEACQREVREETGIILNQENIHFMYVYSDPKSTNQTVDLWYMCWTDADIDTSKIETKEEVMDVRWLKVGKLYRGSTLFIFNTSIKNCYGTWAFKTHAGRVIEMLKTIVKDAKNGRVVEVND